MTLFLAIGTTILILLIPSFIKIFSNIKPFYLKVDSSVVSVFTQEGKEAWSIKVDGEISKAKLSRLYPDKPNFLIVGILNGLDAGKVNVYSNKGKLLWSRQTNLKCPYGNVGIKQMGILDLIISDLWLNNQPHIITVSKDLGGWFPCRVTIFDRKGNEKGTYWHPGHFSKLLPFQSSKYKRQFIIAWGCNNDMRAVIMDSLPRKYYHGIVCLDPQTMSGEAPPRQGNIGEGNEEWYALLVPQTARIVNVKIVGPYSQNTFDNHVEFEIAIKDGIFLYINEEGHMTGHAFGDEYSGSQVPRLKLFE